MKIRISHIHHPVTVLGPGKRLGIWVQGCSIGCKGCLSTDTWSPSAGRVVEIGEIIGVLDRIGNSVDGVTISGGEPFQQPLALAALLDSLDRWRKGHNHQLDLLSYSGYSLGWLSKHQGPLLDRLDAVISDPFIENSPTDRIWRGSENQQLVPLSDLGRERFGRYVDHRRAQPEMQIASDRGTTWLIGIPDRGDIDRLETALKLRGIDLGRAG